MRVTLIRWLAASVAFLASQAFADVPSYAVVKEKSYLKFIAIQNSSPVEGRFSDFTADIKFDPDLLAQSSIKVEVAIGSLTSSNAEVASTVKTADWLSVDLFPKAVFTSTKITRMPDSDNYIVDGTLTLRDKTLPAILNFQMDHFDKKMAVAKGYVTIHRRDYGVGQGEWAKDNVVKDEVRIEFRIAAEKK